MSYTSALTDLHAKIDLLRKEVGKIVDLSVLLTTSNTEIDRLRAALNAIPTTTAPTPAPAPVPAPTPAPAALKPLDLSQMQLWAYDRPWHASEWNNNNGPLPWKYDHIKVGGSGVVFTMDGAGAPQLQGTAGTPAQMTGFWEVEVTLPVFRDGVVVAPLWLWDADSKDEIDFEFAGRNGLDCTMHVYVNGQDVKDSVRLFADQDLSGTKHIFGILRTPDKITMFVDRKAVHTWEKAKMKQFISHPVKPWIEMWAGNNWFDGWLKPFKPFAAGEKMTMTVHGYGYTPA